MDEGVARVSVAAYRVSASTETAGLLFASENSGNPIMRLDWLVRVMCVTRRPKCNHQFTVRFRFCSCTISSSRDWITARTRRTARPAATPPTTDRATLLTATVACPARLRCPACRQRDYPASAFPTRPAPRPTAIIYHRRISHRQDLINSCRTPV